MRGYIIRVQVAQPKPALLFRAAEQLRLTVLSTYIGYAPIFPFTAAAIAAYHWVWAVTTVAVSCPELIVQQERETAALALNLLFRELPEQLIRTWANIRAYTDALVPEAVEPDNSPEGKAAALAATAAAGAAAVGLLELQGWVREGLVLAVLPTETPRLTLLADALALAAESIGQGDLGDGERFALTDVAYLLVRQRPACCIYLHGAHMAMPT